MNMKRSQVTLAALAMVLFFAGVYFWGPSRTPPLQQPLLRLRAANFSDFEAAFNATPDAPRLVLLLSPT
jgi:hypothetical protein